MSLAPFREPEPPLIAPAAPMHRRRLFGVTLGHFLNDFHISWLSLLLPPLVVRFDLSLALAGLLATILNTSAAMAQPLFGLAADRVARGVFVALGPVLTVAAMSVTGILPTYGLLVVALLLAGAGTAAFHPQAAALTGFLSGARRATGLSVFVAGGELAYALGPLYVAAVLQWQGLPWTLAAGLPGLAVAVALAMQIRHWPTAVADRSRALGRDLAVERRALFLLWTYVVVRSIVSLSFLTFLPLLLRREFGASLVMGGAAVFLFGGIGALGGVLGGVLADRVGRRAVLVASFVVSGPLLGLYLQVPVGWGLLLLPAAGTLLYLSAPVTIVMAQERLPHRASLASSIVMGLAWGVAALMLTPVGALADRWGLHRTLLLTLMLMAVGLAAALGLRSPGRSSAAAPVS